VLLVKRRPPNISANKQAILPAKDIVNLLTNPELTKDYDADGVVDGWSVVATGGTIVTNSIDAGQKVDITDSDSDNDYQDIYRNISGFIPGDIVSLQVKSKISTATNFKVQVQLRFIDAADATLSTHIKDLTQALADYSLIKIENKIAPANTAKVRIVLRSYSLVAHATGVA